MKTFKITIEEKTANYLQRLGFEIDSRLAIIDRMFVNHKDDTDTSVFDSVPWKKYNKEFEELNVEYTMAKDSLTKQLIPTVSEAVGYECNDFTWKIEDFQAHEVIITVPEN